MYAQQGRKRPHQDTVSKPVAVVYIDIDEEEVKENVPTQRQKIVQEEPVKYKTPKNDVEFEEVRRQRTTTQEEERVLFKYPSKRMGEIDSVDVSRKEVKRLCFSDWLGDGLISFMINLYALEMLTSEIRGKIWIPTTNFFSKIVENGKVDGKGNNKIWQFDKTSRNKRTQKEEMAIDNILENKLMKAGTSTVNYFTKKALIIPINHKNEHWMLALILNPGNMVGHGNKVNSKKCHIMVLDSMNDPEALIRKQHVEHILTKWLAFKFEAMDLPTLDINYAPGPSITIVKNLPKQRNKDDCGGFMTDFIGEMFYKEKKTGFFNWNFDELDWKAVFPNSIAGKNSRKFIFRNVVAHCEKNVREEFKKDPYFEEFEHLIQK